MDNFDIDAFMSDAQEVTPEVTVETSSNKRNNVLIFLAGIAVGAVVKWFVDDRIDRFKTKSWFDEYISSRPVIRKKHKEDDIPEDFDDTDDEPVDEETPEDDNN